jgi:hypothetical protein
MKKIALMAILLTVVGGMAVAQGRTGGSTGIGLIFGEPSGLSLKVWTSRTIAFDAAAAWSFVNGGSFQVHGDLLFHSYDLFRVERGRMALYYGFGGRFRTARNNVVDDKATLSFRVPVGISYEFENTPFELFFEVVPMLDLIPATEAAIGGGMGFRYYF